MPRNNSRTVRLDGASTQAMPSEKARSTRAPRRGHHCVPNATKNSHSRIPAPQLERIKERHILGQSQREIAREEGRSRQAIARIVRSSEMTEYVERMKEEFRGLVPDALSAIRHALQIQKDARIGFEILRNVGVAPPEGQAELPPTQTPEESGEEHQARGLAAVILESHRAFGIELPPDMQRVLDLDESAHPAEKETEETRPLRPESGRISSGCR